MSLGYAFAGLLLLLFWFLRRGEPADPDAVVVPEPRTVEAAPAAGA